MTYLEQIKLRQNIRALFLAGWTSERIKKRLGCGDSVVNDIKRRMGLVKKESR